MKPCYSERIWQSLNMAGPRLAHAHPLQGTWLIGNSVQSRHTVAEFIPETNSPVDFFSS